MAGYLAGSSKTAPRILVFSIAIDADNSFYVKFIHGAFDWNKYLNYWNVVDKYVAPWQLGYTSLIPSAPLAYSAIGTGQKSVLMDRMFVCLKTTSPLLILICLVVHQRIRYKGILKSCKILQLTVFLQIVVATTILSWGFGCDNYSRETTIQRRKLLISFFLGGIHNLNCCHTMYVKVRKFQKIFFFNLHWSKNEFVFWPIELQKKLLLRFMYKPLAYIGNLNCCWLKYVCNTFYV